MWPGRIYDLDQTTEVGMRSGQRNAILAASLLVCLVVPAESASTKICGGRQATLSCLKKNFGELYQSDYDRFFAILRSAEKKATKCDSLANTVGYLEVESFIEGNAEVREYFSEVIEKLCTTRPRCLLDALSRADEAARTAIIRQLRNPTFLEDRAIREVLVRYRNHPKYKTIMDLYFAP
jgi:hypothetical protein